MEYELDTIRDAPKRRERDFVSLFNALWYKDFPVVYGKERGVSRANWTTHIASVVKQSSDLLGLLTRFETGNRTDAVIQRFESDRLWAKVEWEWIQVFRPQVNELCKLREAADSCDVSIFIGYAHIDNREVSLNKIREEWNGCGKPLLIFLITFREIEDRARVFDKLETYRITNGSLRRIRRQPALPWQVEGSRWQAERGQ
ncbi:hypothetical protein [Methylocystis sp. Sn-Cys]|uniref:hypothetical protein n=1 Tax=Methylocystis sp. Sn-Cys TaxID=1701263 RepID=UPI001920590E|nr:hypothetical protein [Methylocystis sp. Sn-Cys]MBL1255719.1 hypothetical protein [Methylocystis sp. Sn-Cys]